MSDGGRTGVRLRMIDANATKHLRLGLVEKLLP